MKKRVRRSLIVILFLLVLLFEACVEAALAYEEASQVSLKRKMTERMVPVSATNIERVIVSEGRYCVYDGNRYGFLDEEGNEIAEFCYEKAYPYHEGLACVRKDGKYGFLNLEGEVAIPFIFDKTTPFSEGLAYFVQGDRYGFMDKTGTPVFYLRCDSVSSFREGLAYYSVDGKYGYIDRTGNRRVRPIYDDAGYFENGVAIIRKDGKFGAINTAGEEIIKPIYDRIEREEEVLIATIGDDKICMDYTGEQILEGRYTDIYAWDSELRFYRDGKCGLATMDGTILMDLQYTYVDAIPDTDYFIVRNEEQSYGVVDANGEEKVPFAYDYMLYDDGVEGGVLRVKRDAKYGVLDVPDFTERIPLIYDDIRHFVDGRAVVSVDGKYGVVDADGNIDIRIDGDYMVLYDDGNVKVVINSVYILGNRQNYTITADEYDRISLAGEYYEVRLDGKTGIISKTGELCIPIKYAYISDYDVYGAENVFIAVQYGEDGQDAILKLGEIVEEDISEYILCNEITPRIETYWNEIYRTENGKLVAEARWMWKTEYRLYKADSFEQPILYYCKVPYGEYSNGAMSDTGFFAIRDNHIEELLRGYDSGGTSGGDYVCLWYDDKEQRVLLGKDRYYGGGAGYGTESEVYDWESGERSCIEAFYIIEQSADWFEEDEMLANPELFYNWEGTPFTRETIQDAIAEEDYAQAYMVNEVVVSREAYEAESARYRYMEPIK